MRLKAKISGADDLVKKVDKIVAAVDGRKQGKRLQEAAEPILERMQQLVPVRSGALRKSLGIALDNDGLTVRIGPIGDPKWRAHFVEFGTVHMSAEPFIRPAFDGEKDQVSKKVAAQLRSDILNAAR